MFCYNIIVNLCGKINQDADIKMCTGFCTNDAMLV